jgi:DNA invertase Pin-like site-specific DNA recombinase
MTERGRKIAEGIATAREQRRQAGEPDRWGRISYVDGFPNGPELVEWVRKAKDDDGLSWTQIADALHISRSMARRIYARCEK